ncbi:MAG: hypothetical protein RLN72_08875, partial [Henriciella sp.]
MKIYAVSVIAVAMLAGCGVSETEIEDTPVAPPSYEADAMLAKTLPELADDLAAGTLTSKGLTHA